MTLEHDNYHSLARRCGIPTTHDGLVILGYPEPAGGCTAKLLAWIETVRRGLPVLLVRPAPVDNKGDRLPEWLAGAVTLPHHSEQGQRLMGALEETGMRAPLLVLLNPDYLSLARGMFASARVFVVTSQFRDSPPSFPPTKPPYFDEDPVLTDRSLFFERCVDVLLYENEDDLEWMSCTYSYFCQSHRIAVPDPLWQEMYTDYAARPGMKAARFPHRLNVLVMLGCQKRFTGQTGDNALQHFCLHSRHNIHTTRLPAHAADNKRPPETVDISAFDVLLLDDQAICQIRVGQPAEYGAAVKSFTGFKACLLDRPEAGATTASTAGQLPGLTAHIDTQTLDQWLSDGNLLFDNLLNQLMPGLPNWQLHQERRFLPNHAWSANALTPTPSVQAFGDEIATGRNTAVPSARQTETDEELDALRREINALDRKISSLGHKPAPGRNPLASLKPALLQLIRSLFRAVRPGRQD